MVLMVKRGIQMDTDKVKKLQDTIRKLQLQNEQLRAQQFAKNGLIGNQVCDSSKETDTDPEIIPLNEIDLSDEQTWLYIPSKAPPSDTKIDIVAWLRRKAEGNNNVVKEPSNFLSERLMPMDHGDKSIDTRTFTRPKKRIGVLSSLTSSSLPENLKREEKRVGGHDELSAMLQSAGLPIKGVLDSILQKHRKNPVVAADTVISSEDKLMKNGATDNKMNSTFVFQEEDEQDIALSPKKTVNVRQIPSPRRIGLGSAGVKGSCPALDQTFEMPSSVKHASPLVRGRRETGSSPVLDSTFTLGKGSSPHSEEDCLSTTSDGSLSSSSRPMNVMDDVTQMARLQEESLRQSTPVKNTKVLIGNHTEEMPSPILQGNTVDDNHSDRSSPVGSITDGVRGNRTFSQGSSLAGADSLHSSPMTSPHGSSQALHQIHTRNGWQNRDPQVNPLKANSRSHSRDNIHYNHSEEPASMNSKEMKPVSEVEKLNANSVSCKVPMASQLRPQVDQSMLRSGPGRGGIRPPGISSGIPRPQSRLQSRIPAPMQRIPVSRLVQKKPAKSDWMDGCY